MWHPFFLPPVVPFHPSSFFQLPKGFVATRELWVPRYHSSNTPIPLFRLPAVAAFEVFRSMNCMDLFFLSFQSRRMRKVMQSAIPKHRIHLKLNFSPCLTIEGANLSILANEIYREEPGYMYELGAMKVYLKDGSGHHNVHIRWNRQEPMEQTVKSLIKEIFNVPKVSVHSTQLLDPNVRSHLKYLEELGVPVQELT